MLIVSVYVDGLIYTGNTKELMLELKNSLQLEFAITDIGKTKFFLGLEVIQKDNGIFVCQKKYIIDILDKFRMGGANLVHNMMVSGRKLDKAEDEKALDKAEDEKTIDKTFYKQMVRCLMYATDTRPDIMYSVSQVSRFMENPRELHLLAIKRILHYLKGTNNFGLFYQKGGNKELTGYTDNGYTSDVEDRKCTFRYVFMMSMAAISWSSKKQLVVSLSTIEASFIVAATNSCHAI